MSHSKILTLQKAAGLILLGCILILVSCKTQGTRLPVKVTGPSGGEWSVEVDASSAELWVWLDLDNLGTGKPLETNPSSVSKDLGFKRVEILNRGQVLSEEEWYDYDMATHKVSPKPRQWRVQSQKSLWQMKIKDYYSGAISGHYSLSFRIVDTGTSAEN